MNATLLTLNALALVALVSFHIHTDRTDVALVHINTAHWVNRPVAQPASMVPQRAYASQVHELGSAESVETTQAAPVERYTF